MHRNVVDVHSDVLCAQSAENLGSIRSQSFEIEPNGIEMPRRVHAGTHGRQGHCSQIAERSRIASGNLSTPLQICVQFFQLRQVLARRRYR